MASILNICNRALKMLGQNTISSLSESSKEASECNFLYPLVKYDVIAGYPWKCTIKTITLNAVAQSDAFSEDYANRFLLPLDCVTILKVNEDEDFKRNGLYVYTSLAPAKVVYSANIAEEILTLRLSKLISIKLAIELASSLLQDQATYTKLTILFEKEFKIAEEQDSCEGRSKQPFINNNPDQNWLDCRN